MNILLTGHEGYLGKHLQPALERRLKAGQDASVKGFSLAYAKNPDAWERAFKDLLISLSEVDLIIHAATERLQRHEQHRANAELIFESNYYGTKRIIEIARNTNSKLIFTSTCSSIKPSSFYDWSKRCSADLIKASVVNHCILNICAIFGKKGDGNAKESLIRKLMEGSLPYCYHPIFRDYIHVDDVVEAICYVIENDIVGEYDLGTGVGVSTMELIDIWQRTAPPPLIGPYSPEWPEGIHETLVARRERMLPRFTPKTDVREWLKKEYMNLLILELEEEVYKS